VGKQVIKAVVDFFFLLEVKGLMPVLLLIHQHRVAFEQVIAAGYPVIPLEFIFFLNGCKSPHFPPQRIRMLEKTNNSFLPFNLIGLLRLEHKSLNDVTAQLILRLRLPAWLTIRPKTVKADKVQKEDKSSWLLFTGGNETHYDTGQ
jgi:hypothetical protein